MHMQRYKRAASQDGTRGIFLSFNKSTDIPHFKQVVIMATTCNYCGYKSNEVKSGCGVSESGTRIVLTIANDSDLNRDVILVS